MRLESILGLNANTRRDGIKRGRGIARAARSLIHNGIHVILAVHVPPIEMFGKTLRVFFLLDERHSRGPLLLQGIHDLVLLHWTLPPHVMQLLEALATKLVVDLGFPLAGWISIHLGNNVDFRSIHMSIKLNQVER